MVSSNSIAANNLRIGFVSTRFESTDGVSFYTIDIKPKGFQAIEFDGFLTDDTITEVQKVLNNLKSANEMAEQNYQLAKRYYSFAFLEHQLQALVQSLTGEDVGS